MPRLHESVNDPDSIGHLIVEERSSHCIDVFYVPPANQSIVSRYRHSVAVNNPVRLLKLNTKDGRLTIFPINTWPNNVDYLKPKYNKIKKITISSSEYFRFSEEDSIPSTEWDIMALLEELPSCFIKDYDYGLGLTQGYRFIIWAIEKLYDCSEIVIGDYGDTEVYEDMHGDRSILYISTYRFESIRKLINRINSNTQKASQSVKAAETYNFFASAIGEPGATVEMGRGALRKRMTNLILEKEEPLTEDEEKALLSKVPEYARPIAENMPEKAIALQNDIELVNLEAFIQRYEAMLRKNLPESDWQTLLNNNPFILSLTFGYPVIKIKDQASIGGRKLSGSGDKITDFLVKNTMTNNCAIIEIKTPKTKLLNDKYYREGIYTPSSDISGAINQVLDQKYHLEQEIAQIKVNSRMYDIETYSVDGCLIIGTMPKDEDRIKSFEMFRRNSKDVQIVTFDELLEKLKHLRDFLKSPGDDPK